MKYETLDGKVFKAKSLEDLAHALWQSKFIPEPSLKEWMRASACRAEMYNGTKLRTDVVENHIIDMIAHGLLRELEND